MVSLPFPPHRNHVLGFWVSLLVLGLVLAGLLWLIPGVTGEVAGLVGLAVVLVFLAGLASKDAQLLAYRGWNRAARLLGSGLQSYIILLLHLLVLGPVRLTGARLPVAKNPSGTWEPYPGSPGVPDEGGQGLQGGHSISRRLLGAARQSGMAWWVTIIPFVILISWLTIREDEEFEVPSQLYTLY